MVKIKYDGGIGKWLGGILIMVLLLTGLVSASATTDVDYQSILSYEQLDTLLASYFDNLNVTEIYNTYNDYITNEYYNQSFYNESYYNYTTIYLTETYNDYVTNEYYEDYYYNTYNTFNQTFLNQTFVDNNYYETNNYINNTLLEEMMLSINNIWDTIFQEENERISLDGVDNIILNNQDNCSIIEFMFKDTQLNGIFDNNGFIASTQLAQVLDIDFEHSFFVDINNNVVENNVFMYYSILDTNYHAIATNKDDMMEMQFSYPEQYDGSEIIVNAGIGDVNTMTANTIFTLLEDDTPKMNFQYKDHNIIVNNLVSGYSASFYYSGLSNVFYIWKLKFENGDMILLDENDNEILSMTSPFSLGDHDLSIISDPTLNRYNMLFRSIYFNTGNLQLIADKFLLDGVEYEYDKSNWNQAEIYILDDSLLYRVNNQVITAELDVDENIGYFINFDLTKTSLANLYCRR